MFLFVTLKQIGTLMSSVHVNLNKPRSLVGLCWLHDDVRCERSAAETGFYSCREDFFARITRNFCMQTSLGVMTISCGL